MQVSRCRSQESIRRFHRPLSPLPLPFRHLPRIHISSLLDFETSLNASELLQVVIVSVSADSLPFRGTPRFVPATKTLQSRPSDLKNGTLFGQAVKRKTLSLTIEFISTQIRRVCISRKGCDEMVPSLTQYRRQVEETQK